MKSRYHPHEMLFCCIDSPDMGCVAVYLCPKDYFESNGYMYDQSVDIVGFDMPELMEAIYESSEDMPTTIQKLTDLGFKDSPAFVDFIMSCE